MRQRVAITGIGAVTPIGICADGLWSGVRSGTSAVRAITRFDPSDFSSRVAAEIDFDPLDFMSPKRARRLDRFSQLALAVFGGAASSNITIDLGLHGPSLAYGNSCAAGLIAIGEAMRLVRSGQVPVMLAGGAEAPLAPLTFGAFSMIRVLSTRNDDPATSSRPFDAGRDGFVIGEGACVLTLETFEHAAARGARIYAELLGYATTSDAHHMTAPHPDGTFAARAMTEAMIDADVAPEEIDYINAHGSSTVLNDSTECRAIRIALGVLAERVAVSGTKGLHGHALGATGAMETAICLL